VWDSFLILSLLEDCHSRQQALMVPHDGTQKNRFTEAIRARNLRFRLYSQPEIRHYCKKCVRFYHGPDGNVSHMVSVVVIDGVTVGHPCCAIHNCHQPLASSRHRFCPQDAVKYNTICAIVGCDNPIVAGSLACADPSHQDVERIHNERGQARFQLQERLQRARVAHPNITDLEDDDSSELVDEDLEEEFDVQVSNSQGTVSTSKQTVTQPQQLKKLRAQFGQKRTHNEQVIVAPCGMIFARETFYGAEGVASVIISTII
jgi:hypothetical protein